MPDAQCVHEPFQVSGVLILYQGHYGGTDFLLKRAERWLLAKGVTVFEESALVRGDRVDLVVLPTSRLDDLWVFARRGIRLDRVLVWAMGCGAFEAAFYNPGFKTLFGGKATFAVDPLRRGFASSLLARNSLVFTDAVGMYYDLHDRQLMPYATQELIVPIAIQPSMTTSARRSSSLRLGWVGRLSTDFKILPLLKLFDDLRELCSRGLDVESMVVVGDGDGADMFSHYLETVDYVKVDWIRHVDSQTIDQYIRDEMDVLFAMGTSALDGARSSVPTVVVQPFSDMKSRPDAGYRWVHESLGYSLGELPGASLALTQRSVPLSVIFDEYKSAGADVLGERSHRYAASFFEENVFPALFGRDIRPRTRGIVFYAFGLAVLKKTKGICKSILSGVRKVYAKRAA